MVVSLAFRIGYLAFLISCLTVGILYVYRKKWIGLDPS